jgi:hypothetical protein
VSRLAPSKSISPVVDQLRHTATTAKDNIERVRDKQRLDDDDDDDDVEDAGM